MKYTEPNLKVVFKKLNKLIREEKKVKFAKLESHVANGLKKQSQESYYKNRLKKNSFYDRLRNPDKRISDVVTAPAFQLILDYLNIVCPDWEGRPEDDLSSLIYPAFSSFLPINAEQQQEAKTLLPGYYRAYRPSIGHPGKIIASLLHIVYNEEHDALETYEIMMYKGNHDEAGIQRQNFGGFIWRVSREFYIAKTHDDHTKLPQSLILRCSVCDAHKCLVFVGSYQGMTYKLGGSKIFCSKFYAERIKAKPGEKGWIASLKKSCGYKNREYISPNVLKEIDPDDDMSLIYF